MKDKEQLIIPEKTAERYIAAEHEWSSMRQFIRENKKDCIRTDPPDYLIKRYGLGGKFYPIGLAWYLMDQYFKGNITIKEDVQPEPGRKDNP